MVLFVIFDEKKNRIGVWFSCNFSGFLAIGTYIVTYVAGEKCCCQWCRFSYLWCYCLWCNLVTESKNSCQWYSLAFGAVTNGQVSKTGKRRFYFSPKIEMSRLVTNAVVRPAKAQIMRTAKTLIRLGGCPGWSESSLGAHSLCWFCHEAAQMYSVKNQVKSGIFVGNTWLPVLSPIPSIKQLCFDNLCHGDKEIAVLIWCYWDAVTSPPGVLIRHYWKPSDNNNIILTTAVKDRHKINLP